MLLTYNESFCFCTLCPNCYLTISTSPKQESKHSRVLFLLKPCHNKLIFPAESLKNIWLMAYVKSTMGLQWNILYLLRFQSFMFSDQISGSCQIEVITFLIGMDVWAELASMQHWLIQFLAEWHLANFCMHEKKRQSIIRINLVEKGYIVTTLCTYLSRNVMHMFFLIHECSFNLYCCHKCFIIQKLQWFQTALGHSELGTRHHQYAKFTYRGMARTRFPCLKGRDVFW